MNALPIVGVMGSGLHAHEDLAVPLGRRLARLPVHLLTGGGSGVMESVSRGFASVEGRAGLVIGVLPIGEPGAGAGGSEDQAGRSGGRPPRRGEAIPPACPNRWVEIAIRTHLGKAGAEFDSRNHVNVLTSDVVVALPGSAGTASEIALSVRYGRPVVLFGDLGRAAGLPPEVATARTVDEVISLVRETLRDFSTASFSSLAT